MRVFPSILDRNLPQRFGPLSGSWPGNDTVAQSITVGDHLFRSNGPWGNVMTIQHLQSNSYSCLRMGDNLGREVSAIGWGNSDSGYPYANATFWETAGSMGIGDRGGSHRIVSAQFDADESQFRYIRQTWESDGTVHIYDTTNNKQNIERFTLDGTGVEINGALRVTDPSAYIRFTNTAVQPRKQWDIGLQLNDLHFTEAGVGSRGHIDTGGVWNLTAVKGTSYLWATGGHLYTGVDSITQGHIKIWDGPNGNTPGYVEIHSSNGTGWYLFIEDDGTLKVHNTIPTQNEDGFAIGGQVD